jgi:hypothetical protein
MFNVKTPYLNKYYELRAGKHISWSANLSHYYKVGKIIATKHSKLKFF